VPDPISSSSIVSNSPDATCSREDDASLICLLPATVPPPTPNACEPPATSADPPLSSAASDLVQKFSNKDPSTFIAASPRMHAPSIPPVLTVRPDQLDLQTGIPRFESHATLGNLHLTADVDLLNANAHIGSLNEDGSRGGNEGVGANLLNGELTLDYKGWSLSLGVGSSLGGSIASGEGRDLDADGVAERCFKMTLGPYTLGECDEL
jgi:hypothetical protein